MEKIMFPDFEPDKNINHSPHIVILGAGASKASFPNGDANGLNLPLMNDLMEIVDVKELLLKENINFSGKNFEDVYDELSKSHKDTKFLETLHERVYNYFLQMKIPDELTIYDKLILSLRKKDLIATFNWDPLLLQSYQRVSKFTHELPKLAFLHGNVALGICHKDKVKGVVNNLCSKCYEKLKPTEILYPIKDKNYDDNPSICNDWNMLRNHLKFAYFVTIFGYSAPKTDTFARQIMKSIWDANKSKQLAEIEIITRDAKSREEEIMESWKDFIVSHHYQLADTFDESYLSKFPRRSCEALHDTTLQCKYLIPKQMPNFCELKDLIVWLKPMIDEEKEYEASGKELNELPYNV